MRITTDDSVELHVEVTGTGPALVFIHEYSGDHRSWEPQIRHFARDYRCISFAARGFLPSDVPQDVSSYSQARAVRDVLAILDHLDVDTAQVIGVSMGGFTALNLALDHPGRITAAVVGACGYGASTDEEAFKNEALEMAELIREKGCANLAELTAKSPFRLAFQHSDPRGFAEWKSQLAEHDPVGMAHTIAGVQGGRPTLPQLAARLPESRVPVLFVVGDEDDPCLEANLLAKRMAPTAGLAIMAKTAHTVNLEDPDEFNRLVGRFLARAAQGSWPVRDARSLPSGGGWLR